jgi:hypothetical protein
VQNKSWTTCVHGSIDTECTQCAVPNSTRTSKESPLLAQIREDCRNTGFDWPSNSTDRSVPPERVIYSGDAIRHAPWHRSKLLRMLDERDAEIARLRSSHETCEHEWSAIRRVHACLNGCGATMSAGTGEVTAQKASNDLIRRPTGQCSWGCYFSENGRLVRDSACTVHGASSVKDGEPQS